MTPLKYYLAIATICLNANNVMAQNNKIKSEQIASLQVVAGTDWLEMPVVTLGGDKPINISFDDLTHEGRRYVYRLDHCEADWTTSTELFDSDYCDGFADGNTIDDNEESINTNTLYTHYSFQIPNEKCRIKKSGNYRVTVYDENEGDTVFSACFMVVEPLMGIQMSVTSNTDIDINKSHQQVALSLNYGSISISNPEREIRIAVLQNGRWETVRRDMRQQYTTPYGMKWEHNRDLIFDGGNEYHKFEVLATDHPTLGIENIWWENNDYHAMVWTDLPRPSYVYDEDANGAFYIRNSDNIENDRISEYVNVTFRLKAPRQHGDVYVNGVWTNGEFTPKYEMTYNEIAQQYEAIIKLKQGYYSYQYLTKRDDGSIVPVSSEGNFFQTENEYQAFVYWRPIGERTDRLVGYSSVRTK